MTKRSTPARRTAVTPAAPATPPATRDAHGHDPDDYEWVPVPRRHRVDGWPPELQRKFIGFLADTGSVRTACENVNRCRQSAYRLRRAPEGAAFAAAWDAAIGHAASTLIDAAFERAIHGSEEPVWNREGQVIGRRYRQSDAMMMFLLRKHFPDRYGDLHRDRAVPAVAATAPPPRPVGDALARLGPVPPVDPTAALSPQAVRIRIAAAAAGHLPEGHNNPYHEEDSWVVDEKFEAALERAKREADGRPLDDDDEEEWDG